LLDSDLQGELAIEVAVSIGRIEHWLDDHGRSPGEGAILLPQTANAYDIPATSLVLSSHGLSPREE
jgi:hypothetical protein